METNHKLGLIISYYLSRFNDEGYQNLGFGNQINTHNKIGELLSVNPHTIKNWRDEFDPLFGHRVGWYQRPMSPSRIRVAQAIDDLEEQQIREIVLDILSGKIQNDEEELEHLLKIVTTDAGKKKNSKFILRTPTGKAAEEHFLKHFIKHKKPFNGNLIDCRDYGVGYDFRIEDEDGNYYIEVKGLTEISGGVLFTSKGWSVAGKEKENYFLCIVSNLGTNPEIIFIQNPAAKFTPKKNIYTSIQISYSLTQNQLSEFYD